MTIVEGVSPIETIALPIVEGVGHAHVRSIAIVEGVSPIETIALPIVEVVAHAHVRSIATATVTTANEIAVITLGLFRGLLFFMVLLLDMSFFIFRMVVGVLITVFLCVNRKFNRVIMSFVNLDVALLLMASCLAMLLLLTAFHRGLLLLVDRTMLVSIMTVLVP